MKQRLGVAAALLKDPRLLILDEPSNGLDPQGIVEMRDLVRGLGQGERTVLLSSHQLAEVEQICDRVGVILRGHMVAEGTVEELRGQTGLTIGAAPLENAGKVLVSILGPDVVHLEDGKFRLDVPPARAAEINRALVNGGLDVSELRSSERSLEDIFLQLTGDEPQARGSEAGEPEAAGPEAAAPTLSPTAPAAAEDKS
jgi:ABC-2 type transport system ATP-binding protein